MCSLLIPGAQTPRLVTRAHLQQMERDPALSGGVNVVDGKVTHRAVAEVEAHGLNFTPLEAMAG